MTTRVAHVRLTAPDAERVRRGAFLLEDALRTASLPGAGPGRLLLVRYLHVGQIQTGRSPVALSLAIEERLRQLQALAVHAESAGALAAPAVYFRDEAEACTLLALRVTRRRPAEAWFWRLAFPHIDRRAPLPWLLRRLAQSPASPAALSEFVISLLEHEGLDPLLTDLAPADGPALLAALCGPEAPRLAALIAGAGPTEPDAIAARSQAALLSAPWRSALQRWARHWGPTDPRAIWLAAVALAEPRPARLLDPALPRRAAALAAQLAESHRSPAAPVAQLAGSRSALVAPPDPLPTTPAGSAGAPAPPSDNSPPPGQDQTSAEHHIPRFDQRAGGVIAAGDSGSPAQGHPDPAAAPRRSERPARPDQRPAETPAGPRLTALGGLFFLVPLVERLGFSSFLERHPHLIEVDLGWALLRDLAAALAPSGHDPTLGLLARPPLSRRRERGPGGEGLPFLAPDRWREGIAALEAASLRRVAGRPGQRVLLDSSGRLPLAAWSGRRPAGLGKLLAGTAVSAGPALTAAPPPQRAWHMAARRYLRRSPARMGLHSLIARPGLISATRTHIDLYFDHEQTDLRLRRLGLDLDPGWVPWLGRVVCFHYHHGVYGS